MSKNDIPFEKSGVLGINEKDAKDPNLVKKKILKEIFKRKNEHKEKKK